ncbi:hypothetical protein HPB51_026725 [Rhipicephalus microplus]|uniref:Carrier domain-containing protein n=1 Tax=Rhipicephalus microplus TaxID=6941 RepID=A0A9J6D246_RHIMP|nr:hypothetical protein HPB51_026725 [Rhipicephalus microplus]
MRGRFLEIGKFDLFKDKNLGMSLFLQDVSFHGVMLDSLLNDDPSSVALKRQLRSLILEGIDKGVVKALMPYMFTREEAEKAFHFAAAVTHTGKVLTQTAFLAHCVVVTRSRAIAGIRRGIRDLSKISPTVTLAELGIDSLMSVEMKQLLERDFEVTVSAQDIRLLTVAQLKAIGESGSDSTPVSEVPPPAETGQGM